jgi:CheY-like chemotaxis protein
MERVLERRPGVRLMHAADGQIGLERARSAKPDLIFLDLHLPDMPGEEVLQRLWEDASLRRIPVVILSADASPEQARRLKASGAVDYLTKPLQIREVLQLVDQRLRSADA